MNRDLNAKGSNARQDANALVIAAEWLSGVFIAPLSQQQVIDANAAPAQDTLRWVGEQLGAPAVAEALCRTLDQQAPEELTVQLQRRYTALFEGIFRDRAVLPYESAWHGDDRSTLGGQPVAVMNDLLRDLDLHVSTDCVEPADHLAIELAALVAALSSGQNTVAASLLLRLQSWTPAFADALKQQDPDGFYAAAGQLLLALIRTEPAALLMTDPAAASANEQREGEFA
ncbi:MAG: TorD/DmsD family molecular chaperone [Marinobacter sp.]